MLLDAVPTSNEAQRLSAELASLIDAAPVDGKRKSRRGADAQLKFERAIAATVHDLLAGKLKPRTGWSHVSMRAGAFSGRPVSFRQFNQVFSGAVALGWLDVIPGHYTRFPGTTFGAGKQTGLKPTRRLLALTRKRGVTADTLQLHFTRRKGAVKNVIELRTSSIRRGAKKIRGRKMQFERDARVEELEEEVKRLNLFWKSHSLEGATHLGYRRIFNEGDKPHHNWSKGGRLYGLGDESYQQLSKEMRAAIKIDGEPVVEIDIRASHVTIFSAKMGQSLPIDRDPYSVDGLERDLVKACVTATLGQPGKFLRRWPRDAARRLRDSRINLDRHKFSLVKDQVCRAIPSLEKWPTAGYSSFDLMFLESQAIIGTMLALIARNIPSLSVHDSLIVPGRYMMDAGAELSDQYLKHFGCRPQFVVRGLTSTGKLMERPFTPIVKDATDF